MPATFSAQFAEKKMFVTHNDSSVLGTQTITESLEGSDQDEGNSFFFGTATMTSTKEGSDQDCSEYFE